MFTKALNKDIDEAGLAYIKAEVAGKWKLNFKADGKFDNYLMGEKATGEWKMDLNTNSLVLIGIEGRDEELKILKLTENEMALKLGLGEFLLTRIKE
ncbi:MAG: hypothetical protein ABJL44_10460 [Algibacter sp.]